MFHWRVILFPFAFCYGCVTAIRNFLFNVGVLSSYPIRSKSISVGNLSVGGTGKSPHVLYVIGLLGDHKSVSIISRGYGRETKGLLEVHEDSRAIEVGDEPLMFKKRLKDDALVLVCEKRKTAVDLVQRSHPDSVIILDDAFQHRHVKPGFSILLTDYSKPYYKSYMLPMGDLREWSLGRKRADCVIVTKCPEHLSELERNEMQTSLKWKNDHVFFSTLVYGELVSFGKDIAQIKHVLLVTGIANPKPLRDWLNRFYHVELLEFADHHNFRVDDITKIKRKFDIFAPAEKAIITTEKDYVRLEPLLKEMNLLDMPWYYQSISVQLDNEQKFRTLIDNYVGTV